MDPSEIPLRDIHLPEPISWWPLAPGWWALTGVVLVALTATVFTLKRRAKRRVQRAALKEFTLIESRYRQHADSHVLVRELSRLVRRVVVGLDPTSSAASETGQAWKTYLDLLHPDGNTDEIIKSALVEAPYSPRAVVDCETLLRSMRPWLSSIRKPAMSNQSD